MPKHRATTDTGSRPRSSGTPSDSTTDSVSFRDVEDLLAKRGVIVSHETIRLFGSGATEALCEGSSLLEVEEGHYGGVEIDGLTAVVTYRAGKWARIYVAGTGLLSRSAPSPL